MSVFCDFQQVWLQRFPESPLPGAWEEDVRANLAKHKQKVVLLKEELEKEEFYVEYLERLLNDVELHKKKIAKEKSEENQEDGDVTADTISKNDATATPPSTPLNEETEALSANMCVNEISNQLATSYAEKVEPSAPESDPTTFVTVIEVNGLKQPTASPAKIPPKLPARPDNLKNLNKGTTRSSNSESISSSSEVISNCEEPYYDMVAPEEDEGLITSNHSSTENVFSSSSTLPLVSKRESNQTIMEPQSPGTSNYVNIEYFIQTKKNGNNSHNSSEDETEEPTELRRNNTDNSSYASSSSLESMTPSTRRKFLNDYDIKEPERLSMYKSIIQNIIGSESNYVEWLNVLLLYKKAIQATLSTSQPIATKDELETIFFKIPDLYDLHKSFLDDLKKHSNKWDTKVGPLFQKLAKNLGLYGAFLSNYGRALDTVNKCSDANSQFSEISKNITCKNLSEQSITLEDLLHKPVARVQKNGLVLHDLIKCIPKNHPDANSLEDALHLTQNFLDQFNMIQTKSMFNTSDRAQRRLVKNSFIVEFVENHRKLRHLFLFNDVIACAKYKSASGQKYTFELKWFIPVENIIILEETTANLHETAPNQIVALKSQASNVRDQLRHEEKASEDKKTRISRGSDKHRKRLLELESQLVLVSPNLVFRIKHRQNNKTFTFFLSSDFERTQWVEAIQTLQKTGQPPSTSPNYTMLELQAWITACRTFLKTNMGSYLLRNAQDESLLIGDLHLQVAELKGLEYPSDLYVCVEVDFYGHFFQKVKTKVIRNTRNPQWNENFIIDLEGCENLRILIYRDGDTPTLFGKHTMKLSGDWLKGELIEQKLTVNSCELKILMRYIPCELSIRRVPSGKVGSQFGEKIQNVCKRQKRDIPFIITACIREVERRGMHEIGIYRVSGSASDIAKLKKSFETNSYEAEQLLKEVDIHSVTGILKLYLRELPEALFTDQLYSQLLEAFNNSNGNLIKRTELLNNCFQKLPPQNNATIKFILEHLIKVYKHEPDNKMSLHNLATVFGPTLLRPAASKPDAKQRDLSAGTIDVMAQAGILYCYLQDLISPKIHS